MSECEKRLLEGAKHDLEMMNLLTQYFKVDQVINIRYSIAEIWQTEFKTFFDRTGF